jgi:hypothetical protein
MTPDPYKANSGGPGDVGDPGSCNRYAYVGGDPVNWQDPDGFFRRAPPTIAPSPSYFMDPSPPQPLSPYDTPGGGSAEPLGGGNGGPINEGRLPDALKKLKAALDGKCRELFKGGVSGLDFLSGMATWPADGKYGSIQFKDLTAYGFSGDALTAGRTLHDNNLYDKADIYIDSSTTVSGRWNQLDAVGDARILLYELAHAYIFVFGQSASTFQQNDAIDGDLPADSDFNRAAIKNQKLNQELEKCVN